MPECSTWELLQRYEAPEWFRDAKFDVGRGLKFLISFHHHWRWGWFPTSWINKFRAGGMLAVISKPSVLRLDLHVDRPLLFQTAR